MDLLEQVGENLTLEKGYLSVISRLFEIELFGHNIILGLGLLGFAVLILYGIYKVVKE